MKRANTLCSSKPSAAQFVERRFTAPVATLIVSHGNTETTVPIIKTKTILGRFEGLCDVALEAIGTLSKQHLTIFVVSPTLVFVEDMGSSNGSYLATEPVLPLTPHVRFQWPLGVKIFLGSLRAVELRLIPKPEDPAKSGEEDEASAHKIPATLVETEEPDSDEDSKLATERKPAGDASVVALANVQPPPSTSEPRRTSHSDSLTALFALGTSTPATPHCQSAESNAHDRSDATLASFVHTPSPPHQCTVPPETPGHVPAAPEEAQSRSTVSHGEIPSVFLSPEDLDESPPPPAARRPLAATLLVNIGEIPSTLPPTLFVDNDAVAASAEHCALLVGSAAQGRSDEARGREPSSGSAAVTPAVAPISTPDAMPHADSSSHGGGSETLGVKRLRSESAPVDRIESSPTVASLVESVSSGQRPKRRARRSEGDSNAAAALVAADPESAASASTVEVTIIPPCGQLASAAPAAASSPAAAVSTPTPTVVWQFKVDLRKSANKDDAWQDYLPSDCAVLEAAFLKFSGASASTAAATGKKKKAPNSASEVSLNATYGVHFIDMVQFRHDDRTRQRPVRRKTA